MHEGTYYEGAAAAAQPKKILILGESHHGDRPEDVGKPVEQGATEKVVRDYLSQKDGTEQCLQFFHKIALSFGIDADKDAEKKLFWDKVFFGNYVDVLCGVKDDAAKKFIQADKDRYNQGLAEFIQAHEIDVVFCFSDEVFDALPNNEGRWSRTLFQDVKRGKTDLWFGRGYGPDSPFCREIKVYGSPHPSYWNFAGINSEELVQYTRPVFEDCCG